MITPKPIKLTEADIARFWSMVDKRGPDDCWEWTGARSSGGYGTFHDCHDSRFQTHRVAYVVINGDTELEVLHDCDNPPCCNPAHLCAGTQKENIRKCHAEGRASDRKGEKHGQAKLTDDDVREVRALYADGWLQREIAEEFGIAQSNVSIICRGKAWKHV